MLPKYGLILPILILRRQEIHQKLLIQRKVVRFCFLHLKLLSMHFTYFIMHLKFVCYLAIHQKLLVQRKIDKYHAHYIFYYAHYIFNHACHLIYLSFSYFIAGRYKPREGIHIGSPTAGGNKFI